MDRLLAMQAFVRVVEVGTFTAVAQELRVKQSTVSKWLAALEKELGVQLIDRTTRAHRVTEAGKLFYERAGELLAGYESTVAELQLQAPQPRGRIRMSVPVVFGRRYVLPMLADFMKRYEKIELEVSFNDRYVNLVEEGFDLSVRVGIALDSTFRARKLGQTERCLVGAPGYFAAKGTPVVPTELKHHECLLHTGLRTGDVWVFHKGEERFRASVRGRFCANHSEAILEMACAGLGVALLARWLVRDALADGRLVVVLSEYVAPVAPIVALTPPTRLLHPRVRVLLDALAEGFGHLERAMC